MICVVCGGSHALPFVQFYGERLCFECVVWIRAEHLAAWGREQRRLGALVLGGLMDQGSNWRAFVRSSEVQ